MKKAEKQKYLEMPTIATCWEDYPGGVEIKDIEYGIYDYIICLTGTITDNPTIHKVRIYYDDNCGNAFFRINGKRIYLKNCLRTNI